MNFTAHHRRRLLDWSQVLILLALACLFVCLACSVGCVTRHKQVLYKSTVFGLQISASPNQGMAGIIPNMQFGLIRNSYLSNPTDTNPVYAAPITSDVDATVGLLKQAAVENISAGGQGQ
jgi:hypothetical protein